MAVEFGVNKSETVNTDENITENKCVDESQDLEFQFDYENY